MCIQATPEEVIGRKGVSFCSIFRPQLRVVTLVTAKLYRKWETMECKIRYADRRDIGTRRFRDPYQPGYSCRWGMFVIVHFLLASVWLKVSEADRGQPLVSHIPLQYNLMPSIPSYAVINSRLRVHPQWNQKKLKPFVLQSLIGNSTTPQPLPVRPMSWLPNLPTGSRARATKDFIIREDREWSPER